MMVSTSASPWFLLLDLDRGLVVSGLTFGVRGLARNGPASQQQSRDETSHKDRGLTRRTRPVHRLSPRGRVPDIRYPYRLTPCGLPRFSVCHHVSSLAPTLRDANAAVTSRNC